MTPDSSGPTEPVHDETVGQGSEATPTPPGSAVDGLEGAAEGVLDGAETASKVGADLAADAVRATSEALDEAREQLNVMARSLPPASADMPKLFGAGLQARSIGTLEGMAAFNSKAMAAWRSNAEATIRHWQSLAGTRSLSDAIALSAEHARQELEAMTAQTRELSNLATTIMRGAVDPLNRRKG
ncbi:phasin family protein [Lichenihabitans sp. Uapishka_5]|uniref:phasin family protein n=1 Tax=Lichenihabitans sp. Uapishka_5 TaxID=3037302 RepID=UPI0029E7D057|nr:phasin family protein [Lichenihabitans sp. Uapishka_5]MDX7952786.1 phasin family protein [Lichenihabitans sp. Uapishka_5]